MFLLSHVNRNFSIKLKSILYNLGQNIFDQFTKLSKIGFSRERFSRESLVFAIFLHNGQNLSFVWTAWLLMINSKHFKNFVKISWLPTIHKSYVVWQLVRHHVYLLSGDNNLVLFQLWWKEDVLKREKIYNYFVQDRRYAIKHI